MNESKNVECRRCGNKWYSEQFEQKNELPKYCKRCYRSEVQKIPEPPTKLQILKKKSRKKKKQIPKKIRKKRHQLTLWKEQNRFLISMTKAGIAMTTIILLITYALFFTNI